MQVEAVAAKRSRTHTRYHTKDGSLVPGVTTILGVLNKPALVPWANKLGLQGIDSRTYVDILATVGSVGHEMICCHNKGIGFVPDDYPDDIIDQAENCLLSYFSWEKQHKIEPILCEVPLVSEFYRYGGTIDMYAMVDGVPTLVDFKTGKNIYPEYVYQCAAYRELLNEHGHKVDAVRILQIGRDETEGFSEKVVTDTDREFGIFYYCLCLHQLKVGK